MTWSQEISQLITDVDQLTSAANVKKSELDASVASTETDKIGAEASITSATASFASAGANSTQAEAHKNAALAIYGTNAAQQTSLASVQASASLASGYAASASAALQQDLSGITAALHRSPNVVTSIFIYDTSKDSDGGAWTERCQNTSWYNETIYGKWLGAEVSDLDARYIGSTVGEELVVDPNLNTPSYWTVDKFAIIGGQAIRLNDANAGGISATINLTAGKTYRVRVTLTNTRPIISASTTSNYGRIAVSARVLGLSNNVNSVNKFGNPGDSLDFYITPTVNTNSLAISSTVNTYTDIEAISCREVTALNTQSGDYFQLTTDGKFYRLWKNLLSRSEEFTSPWVLTSTSLATSTIGGYISAVQFGDNSVQRILRNPFSQIAGLTYTISAFVQMDDGLAPVVGAASNLGDFSLVTDDTVATSPVITQIGTTSVYRVSATRVCGTTGVRQTGVYKYTTQSARTFKVTGIQLEIGSTVTTYESKLAETSISEVFRGNKRDFPRLAAIVTEGTNVNIYDLTEPGRPMWMRFTYIAGSSFLGWVGGPTVSAVSALNGYIIPVATQAQMGGVILNFVKDDVILIWNGSYILRKRQLVDRHATNSYSAEPGGFVVASSTINAIAMTVLPDAPTDPVTGMRVPTIAVATNLGVSVIKHNGTVVNSSIVQTMRSISISPTHISSQRDAGGWYYFFGNISNLGAAFIMPGQGNFPDFYRFNPNSETAKFGSRTAGFRRFNGTTVLSLRANEISYGNGIASAITNIYNTGWMPGDIRRAYLSDTEVGSINGLELVTNGTFDTDISGWTVSGPATLSVVSGELSVISTGGAGGARATIATIPGKQYRIVGTSRQITSRGQILIGSTAGGGELIQFSPISGATTVSGLFVATGSTTHISLNLRDSTSGVEVRYDNISIREMGYDRSYKAQVAPINGTLIRSQLASGTSLVGYSGWSVDNYLREAYSADLDFGTGEFSTSAWVNIPVVLPTANFPIVDVNLVTNGDFSNGLTGWLNANPAAITITVVDGRMRIVPSDALTRVAYQSFSTVAGKSYEISLDYDSGTATSIIFYAGTVLGSSNVHLNTFKTGSGTYKSFFTATTATTFIHVGPSASNSGKEAFFDNIFVREVLPVSIFNREHSSSTKISLGVNPLGFLTAEAFDGTNSRIATTTAAYNNAQWLKAEVNYTTDGSLSIRVNGRDNVVTRGTPLLSLNSRRNLITWSEDFRNTATAGETRPWTTSATTVSATQFVAPDGTTTADKMVEDTTNTFHTVYQRFYAALAGQTFTATCYMKASERTWCALGIRLGTSAYFNLATGQVGTVTGTGSATISDAGNGWFRCAVNHTFTTNGTTGPELYTSIGDTVGTYTGDGTSGIFIWGAQLELSPTATTYQRVTTAPETDIAPLTIGNSFALNTPFPGSIALLKLGATVPTAEQSIFMFEQEKQLFRTNATSVLPDTGLIVDMSYDDTTDRWAVISTTNESYWNGLVRTSVTPVPSGSYSKITATSGVELAARITANPGVDVTIPPYVLREELVKRSETANKLNRQTAIYDYIGGFTGNITTGSTAIASVTNLTYPVSPVGARISGTGIPANTTIVAVVGTTMYISAAATATTTGLVISFLDFELPVGFETESVTSAGVIKQEGATKDYTRLFDGFLETIRFAIAPGATTWVRIQATKSIQ